MIHTITWSSFLFFVCTISVIGFVSFELDVSLNHKSVDVANELFDPLQVVRSKLLNVVVTSSVYIVRWILMLRGIVQFTSVIERYNLVPSAVDDEYWTVYLGHPVDVWELVER